MILCLFFFANYICTVVACNLGTGMNAFWGQNILQRFPMDFYVDAMPTALWKLAPTTFKSINMSPDFS